MRVNQTNFPHPVLSPGTDDYTDGCEFLANIELEDEESFTFSAKYTLKSDALETLIKQKKARVILNICSVSTRYFEIKTLYKRARKFSIPVGTVADKVVMTPQIVITEDVKNFSGSGELNNKYFKGALFNLQKGDIVAVGDDAVFFIDDSELSGDLTSLFFINLNEDQDEPVCPVFEEGRIAVYLNKETYTRYAAMCKGGVAADVTALLVNPVIVEAIELMRASHTSDDEPLNAWEQAFARRAEEIGEDLFDECVSSSVMANRLGGDNIRTALTELENIFEEGLE